MRSSIVGRPGSEVEERSFMVGDSASLTIRDFVGNVTIRGHEESTIRVVATKRASSQGDLERIKVEMVEREGGLEIKTDKPRGLKGVSVELEISAPRGAQLDVRTGAGRVVVRDLHGEIQARTNAGAVAIDGASPKVRAQTGAGNIGISGTTGETHAKTGAGGIDYQGRPRGSCRFDTGAGSIKLRVPANINVKVELNTGIGTVDVDLPVEGHVSRRKVSGSIGSGDEGEIRARTAVGSIELIGE